MYICKIGWCFNLPLGDLKPGESLLSHPITLLSYAEPLVLVPAAHVEPLQKHWYSGHCAMVTTTDFLGLMEMVVDHIERTIRIPRSANKLLANNKEFDQSLSSTTCIHRHAWVSSCTPTSHSGTLVWFCVGDGSHQEEPAAACPGFVLAPQS